MKKRNAVILVTALLLLVSSVICSTLQTSTFTVAVKPFSYMTPAGYTLRGTMYRPNSATKAKQAPTVITCAGGSDEHTQQSSVNIELARRGYAVFSFDAFNHGQSDFCITDTQGGLDMIDYALSFEWVDNSRLAVEGHSNGGIFLSQAALKSGKVNAIVYSNVVPYDTIAQPFLAPEEAVDAAFILCQYDEYAGPDNWGVATALDSVKIPRLMYAFGTEEYIVPEKHYGNAAQNTLRVLYTPASTHSFAFFSSQVITNIIDFLDISLSYQSPIPPSQQVWPLHTLLSCFSFVCALLLVGLTVDCALDSSAFSILRQPCSATVKQPNRKYVLVACVACAMLFFVPLYLLGKRVLQVSLLYPQADSNGIVLWAIASSGIYLGMYWVLSRRHDTATSFSGIYQGYLLTPRLLGRTCLLATFGFALLYIATDYKYQLSSTGFSFLWASLVPLTTQKLTVYLCYFITFLPFFFSLNLLVTRFTHHPSCARSVLYAVVAYTLGLGLLLVASLGFLFAFHRAPLHAARFAMSPLLYMLPVLPVCGVCCAWFYKRTGRLYLGAFLSCFLFTWLLVGRNSTFFF